MDIVARYGGEEFAIIMPAANLADAEPAAIAAGAHIAKCQIQFQGKTLQVTASGGVAQAQTQEDAAALIKRADEALYAAKKGGRNCVYVHDGNEIRPAGTTTVAVLHPPSIQTLPNRRLPHLLRPSLPHTKTSSSAPTHKPDCPTARRSVRKFAAALPSAQRYDTKLSLMLVKLDTLARFANRTSDPSAELAIRTVSQFLSAGMREMDLVARYQSDVFGVLLPGTPLNQAAGVAERLCGGRGTLPAAEQRPGVAPIGHHRSGGAD